MKRNLTLPANRFLSCAVCTPIGVANARLEGTKITGDWKNEASEFSGERSLPLALRFANWPSDPSNILKFTQRWGPLRGNPCNSSGEFSFDIQGWITWQDLFRNIWRAHCQLSNKLKHLPLGAMTFDIGPPEPVEVEMGPKLVVLRVPSLLKFMCLELHSNIRALRICRRPDCSKPYFIAQHGKERYCSTVCANWAQRNWKKRWHDNRRKIQPKGALGDGAQETR